MDWHKLVKRDFQEMGDSFDILPYFKVLIDCIARIHNVAINNIDMIKLLSCAQKMNTFKAFKNGDDKELVLLDYGGFHESGNPKNLNHHQFRFNLADYLIKHINPI